MLNDLIYVYCITKSRPPGLIPDLRSKGLKSFMFNDFYVIVKFVSGNEFSEENFKKNLSDLQWLESNTRDHIGVISVIMENSAVIPFKFGTIFNTKAGLGKFIKNYNGSLTENFHHIDGKEEWSVKIYCDRKVLCEQIDELSGEAAALEKQIMASSPGKAFLLTRKKTELIENEMDRLCKNYGQECYDELQNLSESAQLSNLLPKEYSGREDTMILNTAFLVRKDKVINFISTVRFLKKKYSNLGFDIEVTGPWPPFSFISIKEKT